ncbi:MAG: dual CXXC motif small (seleno)protein [Oceanidesulfovibrio sp.]
MSFFVSSSRTARTTIACKQCGSPLVALRGCREVTLRCETCRRNFDLKEYVHLMDEALETFLDQAFCDRI